MPQIRRAVLWGVDFVQLREKDLPDARLFELTRRTLGIVGAGTCRVILNGRADLALAAGAHGVHLPSQGIEPAHIRPWLPRDFLVGVSAHSMAEAKRAADQGADYVLLGPIFFTESKIHYGPPLGLRLLRRACSRFAIPVLGLGGIHAESVSSVLQNGAAGVAGITLFQEELGLLAGSRRRYEQLIAGRPERRQL